MFRDFIMHALHEAPYMAEVVADTNQVISRLTLHHPHELISKLVSKLLKIQLSPLLLCGVAHLSLLDSVHCYTCHVQLYKLQLVATNGCFLHPRHFPDAQLMPPAV